MATAPQSSFQMRSTDLIRKEALDYGGFGDVYLCYHVTLGQVVLKTMYTGPIRNEENKKSLLEEGNIMASLNHERVVKLLGVIMEERDCSLVMELLPRGNLSVMLETVSVPLSIKCRIVLEVLEGMIYLTERHVIHKDIKPENILVDKDFHIKIADLGLATCLTWSKLTKEESSRRSLWVIVTGQEPYANARSEEHISQCVRNGDRPAENLVPEDTPVEILQLMKRCWDHNPVQRPTFREGYDFLLPFYIEKLEPLVEEDLQELRKLYEGPEELVEKMKSLSMTQECFLPDCPAPLMSSDRSVPVPVEASIEDMHDIQYEQPLQTDAKEFRSPSALEEKLARELQYHKHGSYNQLEIYQGNPNPSLQNHFSNSDQAIQQPEPDKPSCASSVQSWTKAEPVQPTSQEEAYRPTAGLYNSMNFSIPSPCHFPLSASSPSLSQYNQQHPHSHYDRQQSCPVSDTSAPDIKPGRLLAPSKSYSPQDPGSLFIQNASGIQIGSNNLMSIRGHEASNNLMSLPSNASAHSPIKEGILKYEDNAVTEGHLDILRDNIGKKWKGCARRLGLSSVEIETIEHDCFRDGLPEMVHQMLDRWKMKEGSIGCTIGKLCRALDGHIKIDVIQKILDSCSSSC
ncbi:hypothetical protein CesoFtcFv8_015133 [Champsocephalus esox]|uniref:Receptor-interacting serine/threonine-protein kinase 1 n=1 Tax=Champsocephalus esox TaxID=159716 RepID=A0AAN8GRQ1_9TELE|nr:hypothetical protein CesoFtcFv8_015133 [Champsocephalus esox]